MIENMLGWHHSGFNVYCGNTIWPRNELGLENLARYIIRASFSQERVTYIPAYDSSGGVAKVVYESKDGKIYEVDPLTCPRCSGKMKVISVIEDSKIVKKILKHLGLWDQKARPPPKRANASPLNIHIDYLDSQPPCEDYLYYDPDYPV